MVALAFLVSVFSFAGEDTAEVRWLNRPPDAAAKQQAALGWDPSLRHDSLTRAVPFSVAPEIDFQPQGPHFVELFLTAAAAENVSFALEVNGNAVDGIFRLRTREMRLRPRRGTRLVSLVAMVDGPAKLVVKTQAKTGAVTALRFAPKGEFESRLIPLWLERARHLHQTPLWTGEEAGPMARRHYLEQLHDRLRHSSKAEIRREAAIGLARAFYWVAAENHEPNDLALAAEWIGESLKAAPADGAVRQMASAWCRSQSVRARDMGPAEFCATTKPVPWDITLPTLAPGAPAWAVAQLRLKTRLEAITRWWVDERQHSTGELGGAWGDDVEILRHWGPLAIGLGSEVAARGLERIADGLWNSGQLKDGYDKDISDVEHSSEPTTDTQPLLAALHPDQKETLERLRATAACAENWIGKQPDGQMRFHTSWFNCRERDPSPERAVDVHLNVRAMGPALWYAYLTRDPKLVRLLTAWAESWLVAMRSTSHGKPKGMIPPVLWAKDGGFLIGSEKWDKPSAEWDYFQWSGNSQEAVTSLFLAVYDLTADKRWLAAAGETFAAATDAFRAYPEAFHEWRRRSGDARFDAFFSHKPAPAEPATLAALARQAAEAEEQVAFNFDMFTREVLYTDRIYYPFLAGYRQYLFGGDAPRGERYPTFAVTWTPSGMRYARAVLDATASSLKLKLYSFEAHAAKAEFRAWRLAPGRYRWRIPETQRSGDFVIAKAPHRVELPLPPQKEVTVLVSPAAGLPRPAR